jgi:hypothetical protein
MNDRIKRTRQSVTAREQLRGNRRKSTIQRGKRAQFQGRVGVPDYLRVDVGLCPVFETEGIVFPNVRTYRKKL